VKGIREARGLTQEQLARELEVTFGTVNGWENGKHRPIRALASRLLQMASEARITPQVPTRNAAQGRRPKKHSRERNR
jgi:transcriptional regulator with XRE-family HTH domain